MLQRWLEAAFGSKAEYDAYIAGVAATMCMAPGARVSFVNVLRSLEPMRREALAKRQARLASAHHATRVVRAAGPDAALAVVGLPADAPPALPLAPGTPSLAASPSPRPPSEASQRGGGAAYATQRYAQQPPSPPASVAEPGPWEPPILDVRPGSPQESVVLERLPGMTDEDLERLADFMGSDGTVSRRRLLLCFDPASYLTPSLSLVPARSWEHLGRWRRPGRPDRGGSRGIGP